MNEPDFSAANRMIPANTGQDPQDSLPRRRKQGSGRVVTDTVHNRLRDAILSAELRPNRRLVEDELALWLNASRTPVREALLRLEQEGLVERSHGWVVREYDPAEIRSRLECRLAIEGYAARLAALRRSEGHLDAMRDLVSSMTVQGLTRYEYNTLNAGFHSVIMDAADNPTLVSLHAQTKMNYWDLNIPVVFSADDDRLVTRQHDALIEALARHESVEAERIAREHVQLTLNVVLRELRMPPRDVSG